MLSNLVRRSRAKIGLRTKVRQLMRKTSPSPSLPAVAESSASRGQEPWPNTREKNYEVWQSYDWSQRGEEWTPDAEWKQSLIDEVMLKHFDPGKTILEIGPGAGKWTATLQQIADRLILVDLSDRCIELCKERFSHCANIEYFVNDGANLDFLPDQSVDYVWSWDVFVHIAPEDIATYAGQFRRVLKAGGRAIIHHAGGGDTRGGWRSAVTAELFAHLVKENGLTLIDQFDSWGDGRFNVHWHQDVVSVFAR